MTQAIFLSYASQDADTARRICEALRAAGLEVWFDQSELRGGDAWDASIRKQIKECALFVPIVSANTNARPEGYFRLEWKLAVDRSHLMADDQPFFVPVILVDTKEASARVPEKFRERQWTRINDDSSILDFAVRVAKLTNGSASSSKSASSNAPNSEFGIQSDTPKLVSPAMYRSTGQAPAAAKVPFSSHGQPNLDPRLPLRGLREGSVKSSASGEQAPDTGAAPATQTPSAATKPSLPSRRTAIISTVAIVFALACAATAWFVIERQRQAVYLAETLPRIQVLAERQKFGEAFRLAGEFERAGGGDLLTPAIQDTFSREISVLSEPVGAAVSYRLHGTESWQDAGTAPREKLRVPRGSVQLKATRAGFLPASVSLFPQAGQKFEFTLLAENSADAGMVSVGAGKVRLRNLFGLKTAEMVDMPRFLIDRTETSNREFARFVQVGGYAKPEYWRHPFVEDRKVITFEAAMQRFRDSTGRNGPAHWKVGSPPPGEEDLPVRGISWHEAAAYAAFAGKELPGLYHWFWADNANDMVGFLPSVLLPLSNFESVGPRAVAQGESVGAFGALNMAGNVREWVANTNDKGKHLTVGGGWAEPNYSYFHAIPRTAFERPLDTGVRCMKRLGTAAIPEIALGPIPTLQVVAAKNSKPVADAEYAIYKRLYDRKRPPIEAKLESTDTTKPHWIRQKVSYAAGYGGERMWAYIYLPRNARPPYQTVVHLGGSGILAERPYVTEADYPGFQIVDVLVRGGRSVVVPIWKGSFERNGKFNFDDEAQYKEHNNYWVTEMRQTLDVIQSREEFDKEKIGFQGSSFGSERAPLLLALEPRIKTGILLIGGLKISEELPAEIKAANFAPRVTASILMLNGKGDPIFPYETSQVALFNLLGTPAAQKRHVTYPSGHSYYGWYDDMVREQLDWLDKVFGPVIQAGAK